MIWMSMFSRTCTRGKWECLHSWRTLWPCISLTLFRKKEPRCYQKLRTMLTSSSINSRTCWFLKGALKKPSSSSVLFWRRRRQQQRLPLVDVKMLVLKRRNMFFWPWPDKEREGSRTSIKKPCSQRQFLQKGRTPERQGKVHLEKKIVLRASTTQEGIVAMVDSVIIGILRIANTSRKTNVRWERTVHSFTHKRRSDLPVFNKKNKEKQTCPKKDKWRLQM